MNLKSVLAITSLGILCVFLHAEEKSDPKKEDPKLTAAWKELEGSWQLTTITADGNIVQQNNSLTRVITREGVALYNHGKLVHDASELRIEIDPTQSPAHLDWIRRIKDSDQTAVHKVVYEVRGNLFRYTVATRGDKRPSKIENPLDDPCQPFIYEFKRVEHPEKSK